MGSRVWPEQQQCMPSKDKANSMELGLAISCAIVETPGGRMWAMPNLDQGATLCSTLPASAEGAL
jgi:K+-sensing histidine kinase KdpD